MEDKLKNGKEQVTIWKKKNAKSMIPQTNDWQKAIWHEYERDLVSVGFTVEDKLEKSKEWGTIWKKQKN